MPRSRSWWTSLVGQRFHSLSMCKNWVEGVWCVCVWWVDVYSVGVLRVFTQGCQLETII